MDLVQLPLICDKEIHHIRYTLLVLLAFLEVGDVTTRYWYTFLHGGECSYKKRETVYSNVRDDGDSSNRGGGGYDCDKRSYRDCGCSAHMMVMISTTIPLVTVLTVREMFKLSKW